MSTVELINQDNMKVDFEKESFDLIYSDVIYSSTDFSHASKYWNYLKPNSPFIIQTDHSTVFEWGIFLKSLPDAIFLNHCVWRCEWGNYKKDRFNQCFDDILIFSKGVNKNFYPEKIQVNKVTANTKLNPSMRMTKPQTAWLDNIVLTTTSKERVVKDNHLIKWQKPVRLFDYIIGAFVKEGDNILDNFMGSGSLAEWSIKNNISYTGIEFDKETFNLAKIRVDNLLNIVKINKGW